MNRLSREDLIELGISVRKDSLTECAAGLLEATKGREKRLESRGLKSAELTAIKDLLAIVQKRPGEPTETLPKVAFAQGIREEALKYWREAKGIVHAEFANSPDLLAKFRTGVRTGRLILPLRRELLTLVGLLREHAPNLEAAGGTEGFIARGGHFIEQLQEAKASLDAAVQTLSPTAAQQCHDKGLLLDLVRKLVRIGRLAFAGEADDVAAFNFKGLRRKGGVPAEPKTTADRPSP